MFDRPGLSQPEDAHVLPVLNLWAVVLDALVELKVFKIAVILKPSFYGSFALILGLFSFAAAAVHLDIEIINTRFWWLVNQTPAMKSVGVDENLAFELPVT